MKERSRPSLWRRLAKAAPLILIVSLATLGLERIGWFDNFETASIDAVLLARPQRAADIVRVVGIDDADYMQYFEDKEQFAYARIDELLGVIAASKPLVIGVDLNTSAPSYKKLTIAKDWPPIVWAQGALNQDDANAKYYQPGPVLGGRQMAPDAVGFVLNLEDADGVVRHYQRAYPGKAGLLGTFSWQIARAYCDRNGAGCPSSFRRIRESPERLLINFSGRRYAGASTSMADILASRDPGLQKFWSDQFRGKVVLVGGKFAESGDVHQTPLGPMFGVDVLAESIDSDVRTGGIQPVSTALSFVLDILVGFAIVVIHLVFRLRAALALSLLAIPVLSLTSSFLAFSSFARWFNFVPMIVAVLIHELYDHAVEYRRLKEAYDRLAEAGELTTEGKPAAGA